MTEHVSEKFSITNQTKDKLPGLSFVTLIEQIKNDILGEDYTLSIAFVSKEKSHELNKTYRGKDTPTNVLSFALSKNSGELVLCPFVIKHEVKIKKFDKNFSDLLNFLLIHGMLHLKGMKHGATMEKKEFNYDQKYRSRNRRGLRDDTSRRGRISNGRKKS